MALCNYHFERLKLAKVKHPQNQFFPRRSVRHNAHNSSSVGAERNEYRKTPLFGSLSQGHNLFAEGNGKCQTKHIECFANKLKGTELT